MLQEHRVIGATTQIAHRNIALHRRRWWTESAVFLRPAVLRTWLTRLFPRVVHGSAIGRWHRLRDLPDKLFQRGHAGGSELLAGYRDVHIEIRGSIPQFLRVIFAPLGGTNQSFFFRVPASDHNRPLRLPAR